MRWEPHDRRGGHVLRSGRTRISRWKKTRHGTGGEEIGGWPRCPEDRGVTRQMVRSRHPFGGMMIVLVGQNRLGDSDNTLLTLIGHHGGVSTANLGCASNGGLLIDVPSANELYRLTSLPSRRPQSPLFLNLRQQRRSPYLQHSFPCSRRALASTRL